MPVFLRCIFISLGIHALLVWLWSCIPTPVRDPFRFLRHTPSPIIMEVDRPSVVVAWHALSEENVADGMEIGEEVIPEFAEKQDAFVLDMPNIQSKAREVEAEETHASSEEVTQVEKREEPPSEAHETSETHETEDSSEAVGNADRETSNSSGSDIPATPSVSMAGNGGTAVSVPSDGGTGSSRAGQAENGSRGNAVDEEAIWKAYSQTLTRYFAKKRSYPAVARRLGQQGIVWIDVELTRQGDIAQIVLAKSSGYKSLDEAALELVRESRDIPPFPAQTTAQKKKIRIPLEYALRRP